MKSARIWVTMLMSVLLQPASAQSLSGFGETAELPAHRTLMAHRAEAKLTPFVSDGCSGGMSDIWTATAAQFPAWAENQGEKPPWEACCVAHDRLYHAANGATEAGQSYDARLRADEELRACVLSQSAQDRDTLAVRYGLSVETIDYTYKGIAQGMYLAVRLGGGPCSGLPWRWGYGFPDCSILRHLRPNDPAETAISE
ncbi:hypothetical protein [uncultured Roseobacter sp.]|uniref:hypothetical protein n=1 Tax=uncultured Roseobacter sp. TaxID=114847 RepID=UPI002602A4A1|nr:hypothetical protein [uncultured Roseobacter sp.]